MIRDASGHGWRARKPFAPANQARHPQTLMLRAEVVNYADQIHSRFQRSIHFSQCPTAPHQAGQALPERRIEPLDEGRVDDTCSLRLGNHSLDVARLAFYDAPLNAADSPLLILLYDLRDEQARPGSQARTAHLPGRHRLTKNRANGADIALQAVGAKQQARRQGRCASANLLNQCGDQGAITTARDYAAEPQSGADHDGQGDPDDAALLLDSQFIHLHLAEVTRGGDALLMHGPAMQAGTLLPVGDGTLIERESRNDGLRRTAVRQQGDDLGEAFIRVAQAVKGRAFGGGKGLAANRTFEAALFLRMNRDVAFFQSASGWASQIRTKYGQWVQSCQSFRSGIQKGLSLDLRSIQNSAPPRLTGGLPMISVLIFISLKSGFKVDQKAYCFNY